MSRDRLYAEFEASYLREAGPEGQAALEWVRSGMTNDLQPPSLATFTRLAASDPLQLTDKHFEALRAEGFDDETLFEVVTGAALAIGLRRRDRALAALRGGAPQ